MSGPRDILKGGYNYEKEIEITGGVLYGSDVCD
jgi:hypothetical protein